MDTAAVGALGVVSAVALVEALVYVPPTQVITALRPLCRSIAHVIETSYAQRVVDDYVAEVTACVPPDESKHGVFVLATHIRPMTDRTTAAVLGALDFRPSNVDYLLSALLGSRRDLAVFPAATRMLWEVVMRWTPRASPSLFEFWLAKDAVVTSDVLTAASLTAHATLLHVDTAGLGWYADAFKLGMILARRLPEPSSTGEATGRIQRRVGELLASHPDADLNGGGGWHVVVTPLGSRNRPLPYALPSQPLSERRRGFDLSFAPGVERVVDLAQHDDLDRPLIFPLDLAAFSVANPLLSVAVDGAAPPKHLDMRRFSATLRTVTIAANTCIVLHRDSVTSLSCRELGGTGLTTLVMPGATPMATLTTVQTTARDGDDTNAVTVNVFTRSRKSTVDARLDFALLRWLTCLSGFDAQDAPLQCFTVPASLLHLDGLRGSLRKWRSDVLDLTVAAGLQNLRGLGPLPDSVRACRMPAALHSVDAEFAASLRGELDLSHLSLTNHHGEGTGGIVTYNLESAKHVASVLLPTTGATWLRELNIRWTSPDAAGVLDLSSLQSLTRVDGFAGFAAVLYPRSLEVIGGRMMDDSPLLTAYDLSTLTLLRSVGGCNRCPALRRVVLPGTVTTVSDFLNGRCDVLESVDVSRCTRLRVFSGLLPGRWSMEPLVLPPTIEVLHTNLLHIARAVMATGGQSDAARVLDLSKLFPTLSSLDGLGGGALLAPWRVMLPSSARLGRALVSTLPDSLTTQFQRQT